MPDRPVNHVAHFAINAAVAAAVVANGGTILIPRTLIPTVGHLIFFRDSEGNAVGAMQYDSQAVDEI